MESKKQILQDLWREFMREFSQKFLLDDKDKERLYLIIKYVPELRRRALEILSSPVLKNLRSVMLLEEISDISGEMIDEKLGVEEKYLLRLIEEVPELRKEIWHYFLGCCSASSDYYLRRIIEQFPELRQEALEKMLGGDIIVETNSVVVAMRFPELRNRVWDWISRSKSYERTVFLRDIMKEIPELKQEAWEKLLSFGMTNNALINVMANFLEFREKAWEILLAQNPEYDELHLVVELIPEYREKAEKLIIKADPIIQKMIDISKQ